MKNLFNKKILSLMLIVALVMGSTFSVTAAKRIKSKSVTMHATVATISVGDILTLDATMKPTNSTDSMTWSSNNKKVAKVNKYGVVTAVSAGTATITVKTTSKKTAKCKVTVKKDLTKAEVEALIKAKGLSEETIKQYIEKYALTESQAMNLIQTNTLSEEEIIALIKQYASGSNEWTGTQELSLDVTTLPYSSNDGLTINKITVKKEHFTGTWDDRQQKYKYLVHIEGKNDNSDSKGYVDLTYCSKDNASTDTRYYPLASYENYGNIRGTYSEDGNGNFVCDIEQYNMYNDYETFFITEAYLSGGDA